MNLYTLKQILHQSRHPSSPSMLAEVQQHIDHFEKHDGDPEQVRLVEPFALFILLNEVSYDIYGKLRRQDQGSFDHFAERVRFYESACLTDEQLKDVYDGMSDLWENNEREGANGRDGGFWSTEKSLIKSLYDILSQLEGDKTTLDDKLHGLLTRHAYDTLTSIVKGGEQSQSSIETSAAAKLSKEQLDRLITFGNRVWNSLTDEEQERYYYDHGTYGFVEDIMAALHIHDLEFESIEQFEYVHEQIIKEEEQ